jgi:hypothetical protein
MYRSGPGVGFLSEWALVRRAEAHRIATLRLSSSTISYAGLGNGAAAFSFRIAYHPSQTNIPQGRDDGRPAGNLESPTKSSPAAFRFQASSRVGCLPEGCSSHPRSAAPDPGSGRAVSRTCRA